MAEAFITRRGGGGKRLYIPRYSGTMNVVYTEDGAGGYAEFTTSGQLSWEFNAPPKRVDLFCVGGGGGTTYVTNGPTGSGAGGGYTSTVLGASIPAQTDVIIGAGGAAGVGTSAGGDGGTTSIGELIQALGGKKGSSGGPGGDGGSGGGGGCTTSGYLSQGGDGGSNGGNGATARGDRTNYAGGAGQGTPTTDLLGRVHAGGGAGGNTTRGATVTPGIGGASDFIAGSGQSSNYPNSGGGGYGGGAAGAYNASYTGGQGFAMIGWGDYVTLYQQQGG